MLHSAGFDSTVEKAAQMKCARVIDTLMLISDTSQRRCVHILLKIVVTAQGNTYLSSVCIAQSKSHCVY